MSRCPRQNEAQLKHCERVATVKEWCEMYSTQINWLCDCDKNVWRAEVWENENAVKMQANRHLFPQLFHVLPNLHKCFYNLIETRRTFSISLENTAMKEKKIACWLWLFSGLTFFVVVAAILNVHKRSSRGQRVHANGSCLHDQARYLSGLYTKYWTKYLELIWQQIPAVYYEWWCDYRQD